MFVGVGKVFISIPTATIHHLLNLPKTTNFYQLNMSGVNMKLQKNISLTLSVPNVGNARHENMFLYYRKRNHK